jgi:hypothetical protein
MIEVLKQALAALEQVKPLYARHHAIVALRQAIAELESQEPALYWSFRVEYALLPSNYDVEDNPTHVPLYRHPPQRTWVGLTNDELTNLLYDTNLGQQSAVLQAIALLKEKNT